MSPILAFLMAVAGAFACAVGAVGLVETPASLALADVDPRAAVFIGVFFVMIGLAAFLPGAIRLIRFGIDDY